MIITCPSCSTRYKVDPAQFGPDGRRVRCTTCGHLWSQEPADDLPKPVVPTPEAEMAGGAGGEEEFPPLRRFDEERIANWEERRRRHQASEHRRRSPTAWLLLGVLVIAVVLGVVIGRDAVVRAWPPAGRLYAAVGMGPTVPGQGLRIKVLEHTRENRDGTPTLVVRGEVTNVSDEVQDVPRLRGTLSGGGSAPLDNWTFATAQRRLLPGETAPFVTRLDNPSPDATALSIDFVGAKD